MGYEPPFERTPEIDDLCMEIAELVGMLHPASDLGTSPTLHRELRIRTISTFFQFIICFVICSR